MDRLLPTIESPANLRYLSTEELNQLAAEIRQLIMTSVSRSGGHLASNLGVVELTIAMHFVFDFAHDRLVWDVGHQCYVHKILTGRAGKFSQLRQAGGISGFPDPRESRYDQFFVGHAGTAVATAVGLALGKQMQQRKEKIVAVVGDASIVNGLSFEGLNNTNLLNRQLLIILNDNFMAIDKTTGAFAQYLTRFRLSRPYEDLQRRTELLVNRLPYLGERIYETLDRIKGGIKTTLLGRQKFEQLGIPFFGPIDGHDIVSMIKIMTALRDFNRPVILHVHTDKGCGFIPASENPRAFHNPKPFTVNGDTASFESRPDKSFTAAFSDTLDKLMAADKRVMALTAAMPDGTGLAELKDKYPGRIIDVGIAEGAAVDIAAGLAKTGIRPIVAIYSTFLQRCFDQIFQEIALQNLPVIFAIDRAGLVGGDGVTHHGFCDVSLLRVLPNMVLMAPSDNEDLYQAFAFAVSCNGPCAIRYPRDVATPLSRRCGLSKPSPYELGRAVWMRKSSGIIILAYGSVVREAIIAAEQLAEDGIEVGVVNGRFAKPLDEQLIIQLLGSSDVKAIITVEDQTLIGGFGSAVLECIQRHQLDSNRVICLGIPDKFIDQDSRAGQLQTVGIDSQSIAKTVRKLLGRQDNKETQPSGKTIKVQ